MEGNNIIQQADLGYHLQLKNFFDLNPHSEFKVKKSGADDEEFWIERPWDDKTLSIKIPTDDPRSIEGLFSALNGVILPARYSAIKHVSTGLLEVIWTAYKLQETSKEVVGRAFDFTYMGAKRRCTFGDATPELLTIAKHCFPVSIPNSTEHRNIVSLHFFAKGIERPNLDKPISFFVDINGMSEDQTLDFIKHLNAYMSFFDHKSPRVLVHEVSSPDEFPSRNRYRNGTFPKEIVGRNLDPNLLAYWNEMCATRNEIMRFLLCYRIIEYAAFNFIEAGTKSSIKRILSSPDIYDKLDSIIASVAEHVSMSKEVTEIPRAQNLVSATADLRCVWQEIVQNQSFFSCDTQFEGGFKVKALITGKDTYETWATNGVRNTLDRLRNIRNALSHGQDGQTRGTILPSADSARRIKPWLNLIEIIAGDAILHRDAV